MRVGIFAKTFPGADPRTVLAAVAAAGFPAAQYNLACSGLASLPDAIPAEVPAAVRAASAACGVEVVAVSGTFNMIHPDPANGPKDSGASPCWLKPRRRWAPGW